MVLVKTYKERKNQIQLKMEKPISLSQKLYFLGIHPDKGGIVPHSNSTMNYVLAGCMLLELHQNGNIKFENKRVLLVNSKTNNATHEFLLQKIGKAKSPRKISTWVNKFVYSNKQIRLSIQKELSDQRLIRMKDKHFLFIKWKSPVIVNKSAVYHLVDAIREMIFKGTSNEEDLILLSFIRPAKLQYRLYSDRRKRREAEKKLKNLLIENPVSKSVEEAIHAAQAIAASVAVTSATTAST